MYKTGFQTGLYNILQTWKSVDNIFFKFDLVISKINKCQVKT